jgi:hypothetical protein
VPHGLVQLWAALAEQSGSSQFPCGTVSSRPTKLANLLVMRRISERLVANYLRLKVGPAETRKV